MKRCPQCNRTYPDETQNFCLDDGSWLTSEDLERPATAILSHDESLAELATRRQLTVAQPTEVLPSNDQLGWSTAGWYRQGGFIAIALAVIAVSVIGAWMYRSSNVHSRSEISFQSAKISRLTASGKVIGAAISPDGKYVAHVVDDGGQQSIWVRQTATSSNIQLVAPVAVVYSGVAFSPDGNYIYYSAHERNAGGALHQVPVLGGVPRKLLTGIHSSVAFSPDGRQIAFFKSVGRTDELMIANADGSDARPLVSRTGDEQFFKGTLSSLSWSPDGKTIAGPLQNIPENYMSVFACSVESGEVKAFTTKRWFEVKQVAWLADGGGALVAAQDTANADPKIWYVSYPSGETEKITNDLNSYRSVSLTADNSVLATVQAQRASGLWVMSANQSASATKVTHDRNYHSRVAWTPDGRLIYNSNANDSFDLYVMDADGNNSKQLTANAGWNGDASVSADGRTIYFMSDRAGPPHIWRMGIDGGDPKQLTTEAFNVRPQLSPDGQWIVYASSAKQSWYVWKMPAGGGDPVQLTEYSADFPTFSPDGSMIACYFTEGPNTPIRIGIFSIEGGQPLKVFDPNLPVVRETNLEWTTDGRSIVYGVTKNGVANLWAQPVNGGDPKQITHFTSERILWFDFSKDGRMLALARGSHTSDVVLIKDFR